MCFYNDGPSADFYRKSHPVARKAHQCYECSRAIPPGERYQRITGKWDGYISTMAICPTCETARGIVYQHEIDEGCAPYEATCPFGELTEYLDNIGIGDDRLTPEALALHGSVRLALALQAAEFNAREEAA